MTTMPRKLKPYEVDSIYDSVNGRIRIFFDRDKKLFFGEVKGQRAEADTLDQCKRETRTLAETLREIVWRQIIMISGSPTYHGQDDTSQLEFTASRHEIADTKGGQIERDFFRTTAGDPEPEEPPTMHDGTPVHTTKKFWGESGTVIPYSHAAWRTVLEIRKAIEAVKKRLDELVEAKDLERRLVTGNLRLLPALGSRISKKR